MTTSFSKVLLTGATGNVGMAVLKALQKSNPLLNIIAGIRDLEIDSKKLIDYKVSFEKFDFADASTYKPALQNCDILFLLRPPQIADTKNIFAPLIKSAKENSVKHIIFLSVQGVEKSSIIPHHKIEKQIVASGIPYTFLRPAYFMQNFTTTLHKDLANKKKIFLPAGNAKFTLVDVTDIGNVTADILTDVAVHKNKAYELTSSTKLTFAEMAQQLSRGLGVEITYTSPNLLKFYFAKRKENIPAGYILVLIMLHYFPRFQKEPAITDCIKKITGIEPLEFDAFINNNKTLLM
jgi:uncharacterized protein YbjT (DUF2867 family)